MSIQSTIVAGEGFELFQEYFFGQDNYEDHVWLKLVDAQFQANNREISVKIPIGVWERLRVFPGIVVRYASMTDDEIRKEAEARVDRRTKELPPETESKGSLLRALSSLGPLGALDDPRAEQIEHAEEHLRERREFERRVLAAIEAVQKQT